MPDTSSAPGAPHNTRTPRWLLALTMVLVSVIMGLIGGILTYADEPSVPEAIKYGAGTFTATLVLALAVAVYAGSGRG